MDKNILKNKKLFSGIVFSTKMEKTIVVKVKKWLKVFKYNKRIIIWKKYFIHNPKNIEVKIGDKVFFSKCRPISLKKHFLLKKVEPK